MHLRFTINVDSMRFEDWARETRARVGLSPSLTVYAIAAERLQLAIASKRKDKV